MNDKQIAQIIAQQQAQGDNTTIQQLRALAGYSVNTINEGAHRTRVREVSISRDQFGNVIGSTEHIVEVEQIDSYIQWLR